MIFECIYLCIIFSESVFSLKESNLLNLWTSTSIFSEKWASKVKAFYAFFFKNVVLPLKEKPQKQRFIFMHGRNDTKFDADIATKTIKIYTETSKMKVLSVFEFVRIECAPQSVRRVFRNSHKF